MSQIQKLECTKPLISVTFFLSHQSRNTCTKKCDNKLPCRALPLQLLQGSAVPCIGVLCWQIFPDRAHVCVVVIWSKRCIVRRALFDTAVFKGKKLPQDSEAKCLAKNVTLLHDQLNRILGATFLRRPAILRRTTILRSLTLQRARRL